MDRLVRESSSLSLLALAIISTSFVNLGIATGYERSYGVLKRLGVRQGDVVSIYMPMVPELAIAMLACARIGAVHSVVFGGFSAESLRDRINDSACRLLITADGSHRRGQVVRLKQVADEAVAGTPSIEHVIVVQRGAGIAPVAMTARDRWYHELMRDAALGAATDHIDLIIDSSHGILADLNRHRRFCRPAALPAI
jgi:acyl-coenzyme A synthetase/AMP-(fatty) acid ligase